MNEEISIGPQSAISALDLNSKNTSERNIMS